MSFGISLLCVCLGAYLGLFLGLKLYAHFYQGFFLHHKEWVEGVAVYLAIFLGMGVLSALSFIPENVVAFGGFAGLVILALSHMNISKKWKVFCRGLVCLVGVCSLYEFTPDTLLVALVLAFFWLALWQIIVWFDRFLLVTLLVSSGWTIGLVSTGLLLHTLPATVTALTCLLGVMTLVFGAFRMSQKQPSLGPLLSYLLGFLWAGVWVYFLNCGALVQTVAAFGYYLFEFIFLVMAFFARRPLQTVLEKLLAYPAFASKAVKIVFSHILILSFLAAMTIRMHQAIDSVLIFAVIVVLLDLYLRLKGFENPTPTWKELFKNARDGAKAFVVEVKKSKQKQLPQTSVVQKAVSAKKVSQKKGAQKKLPAKAVAPKVSNKKISKKKVISNRKTRK